MNRIVRKHYPVERLPAELREGLPGGTHVTVTVEEEEEKPDKDRLAVTLRALRKRSLEGLSEEQAVERIRLLRDEWDA